MRRLSGMRSFAVVWVGQIVSLLGTAMSHFALTLWAYEITGKATPRSFSVPSSVSSSTAGIGG